MGAAANVLEVGLIVLAGWLNAIFVVLILIYVKIRQHTRIQALKVIAEA
jgi:hypothetical protein